MEKLNNKESLLIDECLKMKLEMATIEEMEILTAIRQKLKILR